MNKNDTETADTEWVAVEGMVTFYLSGYVPKEAVEDGPATAADIEESIEYHPAGDEPLYPVESDTDSTGTQEGDQS